MSDLVVHHPVDENLDIEVDEVVSNDHIGIQLLDLGEEEAERLPLRVGLLNLRYTVFGLVRPYPGPVIRPGYVLRFGNDAEMLVKGITRGFLQAGCTLRGQFRILPPPPGANWRRS